MIDVIISTKSLQPSTISKLENLNVLRLSCEVSTMVVGGTPEKPSLSIKKAATSRIEASPESTPALNVLDPNGPM